MSASALVALAALAALALAAVAFATLWLRERRRARTLEEALDARRDAPQSFFDIATHELRSPLSAILGYQELLADGAYGGMDEGAAEPIERIGRSARHLVHLIDGVVELSRLRTGSVRPDIGPVDLGVHMSSVADSFRVHAGERHIEARIDIPSGLPTVRSDSDRLVRALDLLITSALKHPRGDHVDLAVHTHDDGDGATVHVAGTEIELRPDAEDPALRFGLRVAVATAIAELLGGGLDLERVDGHVHSLAFHIRSAPAPTDSPG